MPDLHLDAVSFRYPDADVDALTQITATIVAGRRTAVVGASGAGKSTLLQTITGVVPSMSAGTLRGRVRYGAAELADYRVATISQYLGLVLQDPSSQLLARTAAADVALGPRNHLVPRAEVEMRVDEALRRVGLAGFQGREVTRLSGGERQRVAIAGVLAMAPDTLCLDEATAELDPKGTSEVWQVLDGLVDDGMGIVFADHDPATVLSRSDAVIALDEGRLAWQGSASDLFADRDLIARLGLRPAPMGVFADALLGLRPELGARLDAGRLPLTVAQTRTWLDGLLPTSLAPTPQSSPTSPSGTPAIELRGVSVAYPAGREVLHEIDLCIQPGEFVGLVGPNGAGKTTLVKLLNGLLRPSAGTVALNGRAITDEPTWRLADQVGFCFQNPDHQLFCRTVAEEVGYGLRTRRIPADLRSRRVQDSLEAVGLAELADAHPLTLGRADRQRVALASALINEPAVLVVDEPTTGQDWRGVQAIMAILGRLNDAGTTIVMITHDPELVARHTSRVIELTDGRITLDVPTSLGASSQLAQLWRGWFGAGVPLIGDEVASARAVADLLAGAPC